MDHSVPEQAVEYDSGYTDSTIATACENMAKRVRANGKIESTGSSDNIKRPPAVILRSHGVSYRFKKVK